MRIVDDDVDWKQLIQTEEKENHEEEEEEEEAPVVAEVIDERPEEVRSLEQFRTSNKWRLMGGKNEDSQDSDHLQVSHSSASSGTESLRKTEGRSSRVRHDSPDLSSAKQERHDSPDLSPQRKSRHDSPDLSPRRQREDGRIVHHDSSSPSPPCRTRGGSSPSAQKTRGKDSLPRRKGKAASASQQRSGPDSHLSPPRRRQQAGSDSDLSPPRRKARRSPDSDQSPRRRPKAGSDSDLSPTRRRPQAGSDSDLSPPRKARRPSSPSAQGAVRMLSGAAAGLVSVELLRKEREESRRHERDSQHLEEASRNADTIFRDKSGKRRDIDQEREEQRRKAGEKAEKDEKYAQWGKGLVQGEMQQRNVEAALREAQKPLARHIDDVDLDQMLREQEREGDPMAGLLRRKKEKDSQRQGVPEKPRYKGPAPPPNRFNIAPGYRWDGVDRSNGFERQRYSRLADKKAVQEMAYKWSVEDM
ncbi:BUD13 homolog isoform X2 [Amia ocellicauda]